MSAENVKILIENKQLREQLTSSPIESLKQELQQAQDRVKESWKGMCEQIREFDLVKWEKDEEIEFLRKQLEATKVIAEQPIAVQPTVSSGTSNVEWVLPTSTTVATSNLYTVTELEPCETFPFVSSNITTVTSTMGRLLQATSKYPNPSLIQSMREPTVTTVLDPYIRKSCDLEQLD